MSQPQLRVKFVVAAGVVGASLIAATFVGCQTSPTSQGPSGPYGQYNGNQFSGAANGQQPSPYGSSPQMASAGGAANGFPPQSQQAFLNETQRLGTQQNLTAQDVVAMSRSGVPDQQIAMAVQQRGAALRATPGASQYLAQNGVNPAVLGMGQAGNPNQIGASYPGAYAPQVAMNDQQAAYAANQGQARPMFNSATASVMPAGYPQVQAQVQSDPGQVQAANGESTLATPALDPASAAAANGAMNGQSWRAMPH